jgi:hypothetical protein
VAVPGVFNTPHCEAQYSGSGGDRAIEVGKAGCDNTVVGVGVEQSGTQTEIGDTINQPARQAVDESVQSQSPQIVGGPARSR